MSAERHQCIKLYQAVERNMSAGAILYGAEKVANDMNRSLYQFYERIAAYFHKVLDDLEHMNKAKLLPTLKNMLAEYAALGRRHFMAGAFSTRSKVSTSGDILSLSGIMGLWNNISLNPAKALKNMLAGYHKTMDVLLEICDQALLALMSLVDSYKLSSEAQPHTFDPTMLDVQETPGTFTYDERLNLSVAIEKMKVAISNIHTTFEMKHRSEHNLASLFTISHEKIPLIDGKNVQQLEAMKAEFDNDVGRFMHRISIFT